MCVCSSINQTHLHCFTFSVLHYMSSHKIINHKRSFFVIVFSLVVVIDPSGNFIKVDHIPIKSLIEIQFMLPIT